MLLMLLYILAILYLLIDLGFFIGELSRWIFPQQDNVLDRVILLAGMLLILDFVVKSILRNFRFPFAYFFRFPSSKKRLYRYSILSECISPWNFYLLVLFSPFLAFTIYPAHGFTFTVLSFISLYSLHLLISMAVRCINMNKHRISLFLLFLVLGAVGVYVFYRLHLHLSASWQLLIAIILSQSLYLSLSHHNISKSRYWHDAKGRTDRPLAWLPRIYPSGLLTGYVLFNLKMMWRSPVMRKQFFSYLVLSAAYLYIFHQRPALFDHYITATIFTSLLLTLYPLLFNQFIFSAESAFFDRLVLTCNFNRYLASKYLLYLGFSLLSFIAFLICTQAAAYSLFELAAILLYSAGTITLLSFTSILVTNSRVELFDASRKMWSNPPTGQTLVVILCYSLAIAAIVALQLLLSRQAAMYYMFFCGIISIACLNYWLKILLKAFGRKKYKAMEVFRTT